MSIDYRWVDGFEQYASASDVGSASAWSVATNIQLSTGSGARFSYGKAVRRLNNAAELLRGIDLNTAFQIGFGYINTNPASGAVLCSFYSGTPAGNNLRRSRLTLDVAGRLVWQRHQASGTYTDVALSAVAIGTNKWHYIEVYCDFSTSTTGTIKVWKDGNLVINETGVQTGPNDASFAGWTAISFFGSTGTSYDASVDDTYGGVPSDANQPLRDARILTYVPTDLIDATNWTASDTTVIADISDGDTETYASSDTDSASIQFSIDNINDVIPEEIFAVGVGFIADKDGAAPRALTASVKPAGASYDDGDPFYLSADNVDSFQSIWDVNPDDSQAWEMIDLITAEFKVTLSTS